jgi:V/A-type H+-transporting ATPase subunit I
MSITKLKKITLYGLTREKERVLNALQELGCLHLVSLRKPLSEPEKAMPERPENEFKALKFLQDCPAKRHQVTEAKNPAIEQSVEQALKIQQGIRDVSDLRDAVAARIKEVEPWGDFNLPPNDDLAGLKLWFYIVPVGKVRLLPNKEMVWQIVHRNNRFAYVVVVAEQEPEPTLMPVPRTHTGYLSLTELTSRLNKAELELEDLKAERESLTRWIFLITKNLAHAEDQAGLLNAAEKTLDAEELFAMQGWVAEHEAEPVLCFIEQQKLAMVVEDPLPDELPPTLLNNPKTLAAGEDLVGFYQMPGYWDWDPAVPVFFSFVLFFAMIMSDAGYAALLGIILIFNWRSMGVSSIGQRLRNLALTLIISSLIWGMLVGSYFGVNPEPNTLLGHLKILDVNDFDTMMRLSVCVGVLHLTLANFYKIRRLKKQGGFQVVVPFGWVAVMWGGVLLWFNQTFVEPATWFSPVGQWLIGLGVITVFIFSGGHTIKKPIDLALQALYGLGNLTKLTQIFGDVLSYLRLFALGLASASLALTFNDLAAQAREIEGLGLLYSLLIVLGGHSLNLLLSLMSAVVHGMRLNCIEFFNWGLSDEGFAFKAFAKKEINE